MPSLSLDPALTRLPGPSSATAATRGAAATASTSATSARPAATPAASAQPSTAPLRPSALRAWVPGQQLQIAATQQTVAYLDQLGDALGTLKQGLGQALALQLPASDALVRQRDATAALWQQRAQATGSALDAQGALVAPGEARQRFQLRGLDLAALGSPEPETLSLNLPGQRQPVTVVLGRQDGPAAALHRLNAALAPAGLNATATEAGALQLSVPESQWPALREGLSLRGGGKRFPAGQPTRPRLDAAPDALQPERWRLGDAAGQREALQAVLGAERLVRARGSEARAQLAATQRESEAGDAAPLAIAQALAEQTAARLADTPTYASWRELLPAVSALRRDRVENLMQP